MRQHPTTPTESFTAVHTGLCLSFLIHGTSLETYQCPHKVLSSGSPKPWETNSALCPCFRGQSLSSEYTSAPLRLLLKKRWMTGSRVCGVQASQVPESRAATTAAGGGPSLWLPQSQDCLIPVISNPSLLSQAQLNVESSAHNFSLSHHPSSILQSP